MHSYRLILLVADSSLRRTAAFDRACRLAHAARAPLHICLLVRSGTIALAGLLSRKGAAQARAAFVQTCRHWLHAEAEALCAKGLEVSFDAQWSSHPERDLMAVISRLQPDLVVKDAEPDAALAGLGARAQRQLLRACPAPVLLVRGDSSGGEPHRVAAAIDTGRTATDAAAFNEVIFDNASTIAGFHNAELHLIQVDTHRADSKTGMDHLAAFTQAHHIAPGRCHHLAGSTVKGLMDFTENNHIDFLVLGRTANAHRLLPWSATTERINHSASCDVLTVRQMWQNPLQRGSGARADGPVGARTPA